MKHIKKYFWAVRAIIYKALFKQMGFMSYIGKPLLISGHKNIRIGRKVRIFPGLRMEAIGNRGEIVIEENVSIGQNVHITSENSTLMIGAGSTVLASVFITNIDHAYKSIDIPILEQDHIFSETRIGENCFIGIGAAIQAGTILGRQCIVGAHSVVRGNFPDYCVIVGAPAKIIRKYNAITTKWERVDHE